MLLNRQRDAVTGNFEYKLQLLQISPPSPLVERPVALSTIVTAVRAGISLLACALAADQDFMEQVKRAFLRDKELARYEASSLDEFIEDAKTGQPRRVWL